MEEVEQWVVIEKYPNYKISNKGNVKNFKTGNEIKQGLNGHYHSITLYDYPNNRRNGFLVHRLIAEYFIPNPDNLKIVDHIDGDKSNNDITNLRWCNSSENKKNWDSKRTNHNKVLQYNSTGGLIKTWDSTASAAKELNINAQSIRCCCSGYISSYKGFIWKYEKEDRKQQLNHSIDLNDYICIGIIKENNYSNYYISKDGSKIININRMKEMTFVISDTNYKMVQLRCSTDYNKKSSYPVHKIINQVIKGGKYKDIIDHIDSDRQNNSIDNLEAVTQKENMIRARGRSVKQTNIKTGETKVFRTITDAYLKLDKKYNGDISRVCSGINKSAYGYKWEWV